MVLHIHFIMPNSKQFGMVRVPGSFKKTGGFSLMEANVGLIDLNFWVHDVREFSKQVVFMNMPRLCCFSESKLAAKSSSSLVGLYISQRNATAAHLSVRSKSFCAIDTLLNFQIRPPLWLWVYVNSYGYSSIFLYTVAMIFCISLHNCPLQHCSFAQDKCPLHPPLFPHTWPLYKKQKKRNKQNDRPGYQVQFGWLCIFLQSNFCEGKLLWQRMWHQLSLSTVLHVQGQCFAVTCGTNWIHCAVKPLPQSQMGTEMMKLP